MLKFIPNHAQAVFPVYFFSNVATLSLDGPCQAREAKENFLRLRKLYALQIS